MNKVRIVPLFFLLALTIFFFPTTPSHAAINYADLTPFGEHVPAAIYFDGTYVWMAGYETGNLYRIRFPLWGQPTVDHWDGIFTPYNAYGIAGYSGKIYVSERSSGKVWKFDGTNHQLLVDLPDERGLFMKLEEYNGLLLLPCRGGMYVINPGSGATKFIDLSAYLPDGQGVDVAILDNFVFLTMNKEYLEYGIIAKIDPTNWKVVDILGGLERPFGIATDGRYLYITEYIQYDAFIERGWTPSIVKVDPNTLTVVAVKDLNAVLYGITTLSFLGRTYVIATATGEWIVDEDEWTDVGYGRLFILDDDLQLINVIPTQFASCLWVEANPRYGTIYISFMGSTGVARADEFNVLHIEARTTVNGLNYNISLPVEARIIIRSDNGTQVYRGELPMSVEVPNGAYVRVYFKRTAVTSLGRLRMIYVSDGDAILTFRGRLAFRNFDGDMTLYPVYVPKVRGR